MVLEKVKKGEVSKHEAQRRYGISIRTLTRRLQSGNTTKSGLGPSGGENLHRKMKNNYLTPQRNFRQYGEQIDGEIPKDNKRE